MQIQINHDNHVRLGADVEQRFAGIIRDALDRFADRITRIEMHITDENAGKHGDSDKRCMLEARLANLQPLAVTHLAQTHQLAFDGALEKLEHAIGHLIGRLSTH